MFGNGLTVIVMLAVALQPLASVAATVYVVVLPGFAVTVEPDVELNPPAGDQVYETPPLVVKVAEPPVQIA